MLPLAKASIGLIGTISRRTLERAGAAAALAFRPSTEIVKPVPGSMIFATIKPIVTAIAVVTAKKRIVLTAILPILLALPKPAEPAIKVATTNGTTTMRIKRIAGQAAAGRWHRIRKIPLYLQLRRGPSRTSSASAVLTKSFS